MEAFLQGRLGFMAIAGLAERACERFGGAAVGSLDDLMALDTQVRHQTRQWLEV
ncbi:hypothetical protein [Aeromonas salmonicida]|uniref:hypothetical protein n=1 Tax=Aeromonas salmonicida TaxID=645 RepID=UPI0023AAD363|nr:hypothetical protein [Aeromonas salmonicida]